MRTTFNAFVLAASAKQLDREESVALTGGVLGVEVLRGTARYRSPGCPLRPAAGRCSVRVAPDGQLAHHGSSGAQTASVSGSGG